MKFCADCKYYNCFDDGDGRWDVWCDVNEDQRLDVEFNPKLAQTCKYYKEG